MSGSTTHSEQYPFDLDSIQRGDVITLETLEEATSLERTEDAFRIRVLGIRDMIVDNMRARGLGEVKVLFRTKVGLVVCTPVEQHHSVRKGIANAIGQIARNHQQNVGNAYGELSVELQAERLQDIARDSWRLSMLRKRKPPEFPKGAKKLAEPPGE